MGFVRKKYIVLYENGKRLLTKALFRWICPFSCLSHPTVLFPSF